jgi:hypothetical protein
VVKLVVFVGNVKKSLGRNATDIKACSSERSSFFDADSVESELCSLDSSDVA